MSYDTEKVKPGKKTAVMAGLVCDYCSLTEGTSPCTSTETGDNKCFNTRVSCNDPTNYTKTTKEYIFSQPSVDLPIGENIFPFISGEIEKSSTSITGGSGLGKRSVVRVNIKDSTHHDRGIDKSVADRTYTPENQGTFWGKWLARNPYYEGRTLKIYYGYIGQTFSWSDFEIHEYDITDIDGPNDGMVTVIAKDILVRTYDRKAKYPALSTGKLLSAITVGATTATLTPSGIGNSEYPASGYASIGKEVVGFTRSGDVLTLTRNEWGTEAKPHSANDVVQLCASWDGTNNVTDALYEILVTGAGIPASYIPTTDWDTEEALWLLNANVKGILMRPESIEKVISEWCESFMFDLHWDPVAKELNLNALAPEAPGETINTFTETSNIIKGSFKVERVSDERFTEVRVYYGKIDYSEKDELENFANGQVAIDVNLGSDDQYGNTIKTIYSRWFDSSVNALQLAGRTLARFSDTPEHITFELEQKDHGKLAIAGRAKINSMQGVTGANIEKTFQVTEVNEGRTAGQKFKVKAKTSSFNGRYIFIAPNATPDYFSASDNERALYFFICENTGDFSDGSYGYKII